MELHHHTPTHTLNHAISPSNRVNLTLGGSGTGCGSTPERQAAIAAANAIREAEFRALTFEVWYTDLGDRGPVAVIDEPGRFGPGEYQFVGSASEDPDGGPLRYQWDFGDGTAGATSAVAAHTYTKPGTYTVTLTVTDEEDVQASTSVVVEVEAPQLGIALVLPPDPLLLDEGDVVPVEVRLVATEGVGNLTGVEFVGDPLVPTGSMTLTSGPTPDIPADLELEPGGAPVSFAFEVTAGRPGSFRLESTAMAFDRAGRPARSPPNATAGSVSSRWW